MLHPITQEKKVNTGEYVLILKIEMFGTQKSAMTLLFIGFDFLPIYKADSGGSWTFSFMSKSPVPTFWRFFTVAL